MPRRLLEWVRSRGLVFFPLLAEAAIFGVDLVTPLGVPIPTFYVGPVLLGLWIPGRFTIVIAAVSTVLAVIGLYASPGGPFWLGAVNRGLALSLIWGTFAVVVRFRAAKAVIEAKVEQAALAERALQRSLKELADITHALDQSAIVAITDTRGLITYANDKLCEISQYQRAELLGHDHRIVNSGYHPKEFMRTLWFTIASGRIWRGEIRNRAKDGSYYWVDTTIVPFLDASRKPYQYVSIRSDITERKRAEAKLQEQETLARLGEMAAVVAHEVRNPIAGIRGAVQIVGSRLPAENRDRTVLGDVVARLDSLNELVQDLLLFARPRPPKSGPVAVKSLLEEAAALLARDPACAAMRIRYSGDSPIVQADAEQLQRVFLNLFLNAAQAMAGQGWIEVSITGGNGRCDIAVRDYGPGIPTDMRERLFQPFVTTKHHGSGLGLAIARRIVELHDGTISAGAAPGGGTLLTISLPTPRPSSRT